MKNIPIATIEQRIASLKRAINVLFAYDIDVIDVDLNRTSPVITIPDMKRNSQIGVASQYRRACDQRGLVHRYQIMLEGCRVEWDRVGG